MVSGKDLFLVVSLCWGSSLVKLGRNRGGFGLVYLFLCIIPLCMATSSFLALQCMWGVLGCDCSLYVCFSPFAQAVSAPSPLYSLCHFNINSVLFNCWRHFSWYFHLHYYWNYLGWMDNGLLFLLHAIYFAVCLWFCPMHYYWNCLGWKSNKLMLLSHAFWFVVNASSGLFMCWRHFLWLLLLYYFWTQLGWMGSGLLSVLHTYCRVIFWMLFYKSAEFVVCLYSLSCSFSVHWTVQSDGWFALLFGLPFIVLSCSQGWNVGFQLARFFSCPSGSDSTWFSLGDCCSKDCLCLLRKLLFGIRVASLFKRCIHIA